MGNECTIHVDNIQEQDEGTWACDFTYRTIDGLMNDKKNKTVKIANKFSFPNENERLKLQLRYFHAENHNKERRISSLEKEVKMFKNVIHQQCQKDISECSKGRFSCTSILACFGLN